jgi:hypothetical protein
VVEECSIHGIECVTFEDPHCMDTVLYELQELTDSSASTLVLKAQRSICLVAVRIRVDMRWRDSAAYEHHLRYESRKNIKVGY